MEYIALFDAHRRPLSKTCPRGAALEPGEYQLSVHVCLFNREGKLLLQKRQPHTKAWKGLWDLSCGGMVIAGENSAEGARRELLEELGLAMDFSALRPALSICYGRGFDDIYIVKGDFPLERLRYQPEEVASACYFSLEEVLSLIAHDACVPYHEGLIRLIFSMEKGFSSFAKDDFTR